MGGKTRTAKEKRLNGQVEMVPFMNPATGEQFGAVPMTTMAEVKEARRVMGAAAQTWAAKSLSERIHILNKLKESLIAEADAITAVMNQDNGKSRQDALIEIFVTVDLMTQYGKNAHRWLRRRRVSPGLQLFKRCYIDRKPHGVVGVIAPWNYPLVLLIPPMFSALLAGNTVLVKPSEVTAATGVVIEKVINRIPELAPFVRFLHGDGRVGAALVQSQPDLIYLTGSVSTGRKVLQAAADTVTPVICELGSKDPMIVLEDADIQAAARWGVWGAFYNTGQTCVSVERVYVVEEVYEAFVQAVLEETKRVNVGYTAEIENHFHIGPLTFPHQIDIIEDHLQDAVAKGADIVLGGQHKGMFMEPTVVLNVDHSMKLMRDETFGPVMPIMKVDDEAHAIQLANHSYMGLGASVWSQDLRRAERVAHQLETGSVNINDTITHFAIPKLPFGGVKQSGSGRSHGEEDLLQFTTSRAYVVSNPPHSLDIATVLRRPNTYGINKTIMKLAFGATPRQRLEPIQEFITENKAPQAVSKIAAVLGITAAIVTFLLTFMRRRK